MKRAVQALALINLVLASTIVALSLHHPAKQPNQEPSQATPAQSPVHQATTNQTQRPQHQPVPVCGSDTNPCK